MQAEAAERDDQSEDRMILRFSYDSQAIKLQLQSREQKARPSFKFFEEDSKTVESVFDLTND